MPLRIGVISFAHGHVGSYCGKLKDMPEVELVAAWDDDADRGHDTSEQYGMEFVADLDDLLDDSRVELVMIGSPTNRHAEHVIAAARAGKNILLQKPMALTLEDCDSIIAAVNESGVSFSMAYQMRCDPVNQHIRELVHEGQLGRVGIARRRHCIGVLFNEGFCTGKTNWHIDPVQNMGMFMDDATHAADWFYWMFGRPVSVMAEIDNVLTDVAPDDTGVAIFRFPSNDWTSEGMIGILLNGSAVHAGMSTTELYGAEGVLTQNFGDGPATAMQWPEDAQPVHWMRADQGNTVWQAPDLPIQSQGQRIEQVSQRIVRIFVHGESVMATAEEGRVAIEMVLAAYESSESGRRITFAR
jgi:predicted dehydrogenase